MQKQVMPSQHIYRPDFHVHTNASDGQYAPGEVIRRAAEMKINLLAITDHDTLEGLPQALQFADGLGIDIIPGVEISAGGDKEVHILGFGVQAGIRPLEKMLLEMRREREERVGKMLARLQGIGLSIGLEDIAPSHADSLGRAHIGRALVKKGFVETLYEAFEKYLSPGRPGYEPRRKLLVTEVVTLLRENGVVPVIAHPGLLKMEPSDFQTLLFAWKDAGLMGIEAYHPAHLPNMISHWESLARKHGLLVTGGSDFHGEDGRHPDIGAMIPVWPGAQEDAQALLQAIG